MSKSPASSPDQIALPDGVTAYKQTTQFTEVTVPQGLLNDHATKDGVWGVIHVVQGKLRYVVPGRDVDTVLTPTTRGIIMPTEIHRVEPIGQVSFFVEFYR